MSYCEANQNIQNKVLEKDGCHCTLPTVVFCPSNCPGSCEMIKSLSFLRREFFHSILCTTWKHHRPQWHRWLCEQLSIKASSVVAAIHCCFQLLWITTVSIVVTGEPKLAVVACCWFRSTAHDQSPVSPHNWVGEHLLKATKARKTKSK